MKTVNGIEVEDCFPTTEDEEKRFMDRCCAFVDAHGGEYIGKALKRYEELIEACQCKRRMGEVEDATDEIINILSAEVDSRFEARPDEQGWVWLTIAKQALINYAVYNIMLGDALKGKEV